MNYKNGKYIIFCSSKDHLVELTEKVPEWFSGVDPNPNVYKVYADNAEADKIFQSFKSDKSERLKLLFCINMLNEGVHFEDISGVILFRPTVSPIIYKQQIGRALSAGNPNYKPVIFDVVNNFENLCSISAIQEEINDFVRKSSNDLNDEIINFRFDIIDETRNCREIFSVLQSSLSASWDINYESAKRYFESNRNLNVPIKYVDSDNFALGQWLQTQRRVRAGSVLGILTDEQIKRLDAIEMIWERLFDRRWEERFMRAWEYFNEHGNLDVPASYRDETGFRLGAWISNLRRKNSLCELGFERINRLNSIGMIWDK
jgi:superfamily II DNA/RNA helicase